MKGILWSLTLALTFMLAACAANPERAEKDAFYKKFDDHCRAHAREITEAEDEEDSYRNCMAYYINSNLACPECVVDPYEKDSKK